VGIRIVKEGDSKPFQEFAEQYWAAGWFPLPLPAGAKDPPPKDFTGRYEPPTWPKVKEWIKSNEHGPYANIGIRMPEGVFGIDVDNYDGKTGLATFKRHCADLPDTYVSTSREDGVSGIRFYRLDAHLHLPGNLGDGIEIVQHRHRYAVVAPSVHPSGRVYKWYAPGQPLDGSGGVEIPVIRRRNSQ